MGQFSVVRTNGQVTIPQEVLVRLGLGEGDCIEFVLEGDVAIIRRARDLPNPFLPYVGALGFFQTREEINAWISDLRDEEPEPPDQEGD
jgi:AbrB family looped-hinge helix DNA binding protein